MDAFYNAIFFQFILWNPTYTGCMVVGICSLNASQTAQFLKTLFSPFGNKLAIDQLVFNTVVEELTRDKLPLIKHLVDVP